MAHMRKGHAVGEGLGVQGGVGLVYACTIVNQFAMVYPVLIVQENCRAVQEHRRRDSNAPTKLIEQLLNGSGNLIPLDHNPWHL